MERVFAFDPDVFVAAKEDDLCYVALKKMVDDAEHLFALDNGRVEREYAELLDEFSSSGHKVGKLLQTVVYSRFEGRRYVDIKPNLSADVRRLIRRHGCRCPVEPYLIGMAAAANGPGLIMVLLGEDRIRSRGMHQARSRRQVVKYLQDMCGKQDSAVSYLLRASVKLDYEDTPRGDLQTRIFEQEVRSLLLRQLGEPHYHTYTPDEVYAKAGEVDVYIFRQVGDNLHVWIGECRLREEGNEDRPIEYRKVQKLARKVRAVRDYESNTHRSVLIEGYMITNARSMSPPAKRLAAAEGLHFVHIEMPPDWSRNQHWTLKNTDFQAPL